jgi:hypothetical protein
MPQGPGSLSIWRSDKREEQEVLTTPSLLNGACSTKPEDRELSERLLQIEDLRGKLNKLFHTLKTVAGNPHLDPTVASTIREAIVYVDLMISVKAWLISGS